MADYELNGAGQYINYLNGGGSDYTIDPVTGYPKAVENSLGLFLNGGTGADGKSYPKVDMSLWDQATMCATCHVGGVFYEQDRMGNRLPARLFADWGAAMTGTGVPNVNPITTTVWEKYDPATGAQTSQATFSPWVMPMFTGNDPVNGAPIIPTDAAGNPLNLGLSVPKDMQMPNPNYPDGPQYYNLKKGQLLMPNVKEMDCLFCHMKGYNNVMASVMTQAGNLAYASTAGAMLMNTMTQSYDMPNAQLGTPVAGMGVPVSLSNGAVANMLAKPDSDNCMQCHATKTLKNLPEMFGTTGTSNGFLSSAPMVYDPAYGNGPLGKRMVSYDINACMLFPGQTSPTLTYQNYQSYMMAGLPFPQANGVTLYNHLNPANGEFGGGNAGHTGPLYYSTVAGATDQNTMKRSTMPFPRAEWFKRGDAWQDGKDLHGSFGCAGCHFTGDSTHKNQCDPGRGFDMMSGIQDGVPPLKDRGLTTEPDGTTATPDKHDTRNTVKRCEFCHVTGKDYYGNAIETFGAPNPTTAHQNAGLMANVVQIVDKYETSGGFGGQGVPQTTDYATLKRDSGIGNHLDVMDCTVCHVQKQTMMVRTLDATSGMRFPSVLGTDPNKGMFGLFEDPAPNALDAYAAGQYNMMYNAMGMKRQDGSAWYQADSTGKYVDPYGVPAVGGPTQPSKPLHTWQKSGNMDLPLTTPDIFSPGIHTDTKAGLQFRRKIYLSNPIVAAIWNNTDPSVDANGDGAPGGILNNSKTSLTNYTDIFTGAPLSKNNAQGYGEPIFDPWVMRDLKSGFTFGSAPLSVISVGFGSDPRYASAYDTTGLFTGAYKYVSVWSGAVILTEPDQIAAYKTYRTTNNVANDPNGAKSWAGTELALVGDPFTITHGIASTSKFAQGKPTRDTYGNITAYGCNQCHASGAGFFNGDYTMTGTAIPASATFDPTAALATSGTCMSPNVDGSCSPQNWVPAWMYDANAYVPVLNANGDPVRMTGLGMGSASDMMSRPLEPYRVKGYVGDLRTSFEGFNKLGQPRTSEFQSEPFNCTEGAALTPARQCINTVPLQRSDALYPPEKNADGSELKIYCKASDDCVANPGKLMSGREFASYLETGVSLNLADYGIGVDPHAVINAITDIDATQTGTQVAVNAAFPVTAALAQPNSTNTADLGTVTYAWTTNDAAAVITNPNSRTAATIMFTTTGSKTITLTVQDEEGKVSSTYVTVTAVVPPIAIGWTHTAAPATGTANITNLPSGTTKVYITWGDGSSKTISNVTTSSLSVNKAYTTTTAKTIKVYAYNSTGSQIGYMQQTVTP